MATAVYSALTNTPVLNTVAMTGEISVRGYVRPVGGVVCKVEAARQAGATKVLIPKDNWQKMFAGLPEVEVVPGENLREVLIMPVPSISLHARHRTGVIGLCLTGCRRAS